VSESPIVYSAHPDVTPETEAAALATIYRFLLDCHAREKKAARTNGDDDVKNEKEEGGGHVKQLANKSSEIVNQRLKKRRQR
jgi:hypothetical protein